MRELSPLQIERLKYQPKLPSSLREGVNKLELVQGENTQAIADAEQIQELFKKTYGKPIILLNQQKTKTLLKSKTSA